MIARALSQVLGDASKEEKPVVIRVIKHLLSPTQEDKSKFRANSADLAKSLGRLAEEQGFAEEIPKPATKTAPEVTPVPEVTPETPSSPVDGETPPLAGASGREYALKYADLSDDDTDSAEDAENNEAAEEVVDVAHHPVPADEAYRLQWIDTHPKIVTHMMNLPDLELLCNIARGELQCDATLVTIIGPHCSYVVASTDPAWRGCEIPATTPSALTPSRMELRCSSATLRPTCASVR